MIPRFLLLLYSLWYKDDLLYDLVFSKKFRTNHDFYLGAECKLNYFLPCEPNEKLK
jgi:hypothetical protein